MRLSLSSIVKKSIMAVTGLALCGFVLAHMAGNLQIFLGQDALNAYAAKLQHLGPFLWLMRIGLLVCFVAHIVTAALLTVENRHARPSPYLHQATVKATFASRTLPMTGLIVLGFLIYHLAHFTFKLTHPEHAHLSDALGRHDVYSMVVLSFREWPVSVAYVAAMVPLCLHLSHGAASLFQTLGLRHERYQPAIRCAARGFALLILAGNSSIPLAVLVGAVKLPGGA